MLDLVYFLLWLLWLETFHRKGLLPGKRDLQAVLKLRVLRVLGGCVHLCTATLQALDDHRAGSWTSSPGEGRCGSAKWEPSLQRTLCRQQLCVPWEPLVQRLHQHLVEHVLRLQDVPELWELGVDLESDSAGSSPGWQQGPNPLCPQQSCAPGRVGCRV